MPKNIPELSLYCYAHVVNDIAEVYGLDENTKFALTLEMAGAIRNGKLQVRDPVKGWPFHVTPSMDNPSPYVTIKDVNIWLSSNGYPYQWAPNGEKAEENLLKVGLTAPNSVCQANVSKIRRGILDPAIDEAILKVKSNKTAEVYLALKEMALDNSPPFTGVVSEDGALKYWNSKNDVVHISKSSIAKRLKRRGKCAI